MPETAGMRYLDRTFDGEATVRLKWAMGGMLLATVCGAQSLRADPVADFYRGQTITLIVGSDPGGGYDAYARPVSRHLGRLIPGNPSIAVKYMPGAAGLVAANYLFNNAPRDGTQIGEMQRQIPVEPLRGNEAARYDPFRALWLGSVTEETAVLAVSRQAPHRVAADILTTPLIAGSLGAGTDSEVESIAMRRLFGAPIQLISGYRGTADTLLALERGEIQGVHGISWSFFKTQKSDWLRDETVRLLLQSGLKPSPELPDLPAARDLARTDEERDVWDLIVAPKAMSRPFVLPPDTLPERAAALREAFARLMRDPEFLEDMARLRLEVIPMSSDDMVTLMKRLYAYPASTVQRMRAAIASGGP